MVIDYSLYRSILCLNGDLPDAAFFKAANLPLIAADGAADTLENLGFSPQIIIGDLDSVTPQTRAKNQVLHRPEQSTNDYQKSLAYLKTNNLLPAIVLGINGGHLDHVLNNISLFLETDSVLYAPPILGYVLKAQSQYSYQLPHDTKLSLLGMPSARVSSTGLKWELKQSKLSFPGSNSCFNRTQQESITIEIEEGAALLLIYTQPSIDAGAD